MYHHIKKLMYTVRVNEPDPRFGNMLLEQFGGANGELAAAIQYSIQGLNCEEPARKDLLMDIGTEELSHLEVVGTLRGITFVNASIATVPEATLSHIEVFPASLKTLLLGGHDRGQDFSILCDRLLERGVEAVILFPPAGERLWETLKARAGERPMPRPYFTRTMEEAVRLAYAQTPPGGICLHSPACASYGLFTDYRDRGEQFKRYVKELGAS